MESISHNESNEGFPKTEIVFGVEIDIERVEDTLRQLQWYRENGYTEKHVNLPAGVDEHSSHELIEQKVRENFDEVTYKQYESFLEENWQNIADNISKLRGLVGFVPTEKYKVVLVSYGSGGSYHTDEGKIVINISKKDEGSLVRTILHESIHLGIQHLVEKFNISQWKKERLVDLIGQKLFPEMKLQNIKEDVSCVDESFEKYFPNIEKIAKELKGA